MMTREEIAEFWRREELRLREELHGSSAPWYEYVTMETIMVGLRSASAEARMARVEMSRWADDGGRI